MKFGEVIKSADFKTEKHAPVIEAPEKIKSEELFEVEVSVGKEIPHPNTIEHHIKWIDLYIQYDEDPNTLHIGRYNFGPSINEPIIKTKIKLAKSGKLIAVSYCNKHGVWENSKEIKVEV
ncbi:putative superoxide reductase [Tepiditoga spiralis]|uniref:Putative superoxide reductase n=1 Tax=Tepiditoga spiralis TaxID=2108365 RepID=A0A7G1G443_9BACT|nr:class II SORL domain-containing protein [Tepiditoga spiralis]BBE31248.1 putative superoxide reductase [Tepiditoga spiralis]